MAKGLREIIKNSLLVLAASSIALPKADAVILEKRILSAGKEYDIVLDTEKREYRLNPDIEEVKAREVLASYILGRLIEDTQEKSKELDKKTEQFLQLNPSEMQLACSESDLTLEKNVQEFFPYNIPKLDMNAWKKGNEMSLKFNLQSQDYNFDWYKDSSIIIFYQKSSEMVGRSCDDIYVLGNKSDEFGMLNVEKDSLAEEREVYGMLADAIIKRIVQNTLKEPLIGMISASMRLEDILAQDEKARREKIIGSLKKNYRYASYSPSYFFSVPEQGREISFRLKGNAEKFYVFLNSNVTVNKNEPGSQTKKSGTLLKLIEVDVQNVSDETSAGRIAKHAKLLNKKVEDFLKDYEHKKQVKRFNLEEKAYLYEDLSMWNAQISPFCEMLEKIKDKEIKGSAENLTEYIEFQKNAQNETDRIKSLNEILEEYKFVSRYSRNENDKILELMQREETALKMNDFEMYLSCLSSDAAKKYRGEFGHAFSEGRYKAFDSYKIEKIEIAGNSATVFVKAIMRVKKKPAYLPSSFKEKDYTIETKYKAFLIKESGEWKDRGVMSQLSAITY